MKIEKKRFISTILIFLFFASACWTQSKEYKSNQKNTFGYEPDKIKLLGILTQKIFYGPPCYGENPETDAKEHTYILNIKSPIKIIAKKQDKLNKTCSGITKVQIVNTKNISLKQYLGKRVKVYGSLFSSITGHHHTRVLITIDKIVLEKAL